jgi:lipopolysaccharide transport system ATP-binding protein
MSDAPAIEFDEVGKMYKVFSSRSANLADALGLARFSGGAKYKEFWALRDITFSLGQGERLGILGRNGAGKSTLLKLITGNLTPTEGRVSVNGDVQALLEVGGGLHPEFTGRENIRAALTHMGLSPRQITEVEEDIADFTELGSFLDSPFKTYSLGMQARLSFAIGTSVSPEILIIDEVLGAGDAYFFGKSTARMQALIEKGAAVILVSHGLDQIVRFCERAIWIDRGRIIDRGPSTEVVKSYEKFIRELENRRLQAKNQKARMNYDAFERESYTDSLVAVVRPGAEVGSRVDIEEVRLLRDGETEDRVSVGDPQDANPEQTAVVVLADAAWSAPGREEHVLFRSLERTTPTGDVYGNVSFLLWLFYQASEYAFAFRYRNTGDPATVTLWHGTNIGPTVRLEHSEEWTTQIVPLEALYGLDQEPERTADASQPALSRWPGAGSLALESVRLTNEDDVDRAVFVTRGALRITAVIRANQGGRFPVKLAALIFRADGIVATRHVTSEIELDVDADEAVTAELALDPLLLGNGSYLLSIGLYRELELDGITPSEIYDYLDRSFEFQVIGNPGLHNELVHHPGSWAIVEGDTRRTLPGTLDGHPRIGVAD